mmetsp:Transcript_19823/g.53921  ORF Transcript_19823/g.53921 Transcript_19823/m.53921 type:complete len:295 (-) Transcript_19823:392-1276(-)
MEQAGGGEAPGAQPGGHDARGEGPLRGDACLAGAGGQAEGGGEQAQDGGGAAHAGAGPPGSAGPGRAARAAGRLGGRAGGASGGVAATSSGRLVDAAPAGPAVPGPAALLVDAAGGATAAGRRHGPGGHAGDVRGRRRRLQARAVRLRRCRLQARGRARGGQQRRLRARASRSAHAAPEVAYLEHAHSQCVVLRRRPRPAVEGEGLECAGRRQGPAGAGRRRGGGGALVGPPRGHASGDGRFRGGIFLQPGVQRLDAARRQGDWKDGGERPREGREGAAGRSRLGGPLCKASKG